MGDEINNPPEASEPTENTVASSSDDKATKQKRNKPSALKISLVLLIAIVIIGSFAFWLLGTNSHKAKVKTQSSVTAPTQTTQPAATGTRWVGISSSGGYHFVTDNGAVIRLRGFVTTPKSDKGTVINYSQSDYDRMKSLGANYQSIRLELGQLGYQHGNQISAADMQQLQQMVAMASKDGIYSNFKLTVYHTPGFDWTAFWQDPKNQAAFIPIWSQIWTAFKDNPSVVGYDLLNEPSQGKLGLSFAAFNQNYLSPLYTKTIAALHEMDTKHIAFFQPEVELGENTGPIAFSSPLSSTNVAYSPHFYPPHPDFSTAKYQPELQLRLNEAVANNAPLIFGEYGSRWDINQDGNTALEAKYQQLEEYTYSLFNQYNLSYSRDWYADDLDAGKDPANGQLSTWSVIQGDSLDGPFRQWITQSFTDAINQK